MAAGDATYATQAEYEAYVEGWTTVDVPALKRLLERAERDIDLVVGRLPVELNGLKFGAPKTTNQKHLLAEQVAALSRATCAQAEYRFTMGEEFFRRAQHASETGPDFTVTGRLPRLAPKALLELQDQGLMFLTGRARGGRRPSSQFGYDRYLQATRHDGT